MDLRDKAMLVRLHISQWTARKLDRKVTQEVAQQHGASEDAGRYNKLLVAKEHLATIAKVANAARTYFYANTLPWNDDGSRILPAANWAAYAKDLRQFRQDFERAAAAFVAGYPRFVQEAERRLNGLFRRGDYPEPGDIARRFAFTVDVDPLPAADDFRVNLSAEDVAAVRADIEARTQARISEAMQDLWQRLRQAVRHAHERLRDERAIFRDSLIGNLKDLCEVLPRLNLTDDPQLEALRQEVERDLATWDPEALRRSPLWRKRAAEDAKAILEKMTAYFG